MNPYESQELGSLAVQRPLPPSASEQTSLMGVTSTSGTFLTGAKRDLMKVTIDMGEGHKETILVREGETAEMVSKAFATKFQLTEETEFLLREQIEHNLAQLPNINNQTQTKSEFSSANLTKSQVTQKLPSNANSLPKMRPIQEVTAPLFEDDQEGEDADEPAIGGTADEDELEEAEIEDEQDADKSTISQINSLDPA